MDAQLLKNYFKPTPVLMRKLGDALLGASTFITGFGIIGEHKWLALVALLIGVAGKFLSNFFSEG